MTLSDRTHEIRGDAAGFQMVTLANSADVVITEHRERFNKAIDYAIKNKTNFSEEILIEPADGSDMRWIKSMGKINYDELTATPLYINGTIMDVTEQVLSQEKLQSLNQDLSLQLTKSWLRRQRRIANQVMHEIELSQKRTSKVSNTVN